MLELLAARYGEPVTIAEKRAAADVAAAQSQGAHYAAADLAEAAEADAAAAPPPAPPLPPPPPPPPPSKPPSPEDEDFAAMAASMGIELPKEIPPPAPEQVLVESTVPDNAPEVGLDGDGTDDCEWVPDTVVGDYMSALDAVLALIRFMLELHEPWEDTSAERAVRAPAAGKVGRTWAIRLRAHAGGLVGHYYMHQAFAHLVEQIETHGPLQHGNDEVLERGNLTMKHFRGLTFKGGNSSAAAKEMVETRYRLLSAKGVMPEVWEPYEVRKAAQHSSWVSTFRMNICAEHLQSARMYDGDTRGPAARARAAALGGKRKKRDVVKAEALSGLDAKRRALCVARGEGESV